jgi:hypothetical protein
MKPTQKSMTTSSRATHLEVRMYAANVVILRKSRETEIKGFSPMKRSFSFDFWTRRTLGTILIAGGRRHRNRLGDEHAHKFI